jgi:hypothetical protein
VVDKSQLVARLRELTSVFRSMVEPQSTRPIPWDGSVRLKYPTAVTKVSADAVVWLTRLSTMEALLDYQDSPLTQQQIDYLREWLAGGMLGLSDFAFDEKALGAPAAVANQEIYRLCHEIFLILIPQT